MSKALAITSRALDQSQQSIVDGAIAILKSMGLLQKHSEEDQQAFILACVEMGLNPIRKEVYASPFWNAELGRYTLGIIIDHRVYLNRAEMSGVWDGYDVQFEGDVVMKTVTKQSKKGGEYKAEVIDQSKTTLKGRITIYRKDWSRPFVSRWLSIQTEMKDTPFWHGDPHGMLEKNLIKEFFEKVFPKECGNLADYRKEIRYSPDDDNLHDRTIVDATPRVELAHAIKEIAELMNSIQMVSSDRTAITERQKSAYQNGNIGELEDIISELQTKKAEQEAKAVKSRKPMPPPPPAEEQSPATAEDPATEMAKSKVVEILSKLKTAKFDGFDAVPRIVNSVKEHLGVIVPESNDWIQAILTADVLDIQVWRNAYKHWNNYLKAHDLGVQINAKLETMTDEQRAGYENDLKVHYKDPLVLEEMLGIIIEEIGEEK